MIRESRSDGRTYRYGDFPGVFWDADPQAEIDPAQPEVLARILSLNRIDVIARLVAPAVVRRELDHIPLPPHRRRFWTMVLSGFPDLRGE